MQNETVNKKRVIITDALEKRVAMINGRFELDKPTLDAMNEIREISDAYARTLHCIFTRAGLKADIGRAIATVDAVQACKNMACDALILPHASREEEETPLMPVGIDPCTMKIVYRKQEFIE